jgi:hypothetical protein
MDMVKKVVIFAFNDGPMYFAHALMNALDMDARGLEVKVVIEGMATRQIVDMADGTRAFAGLYRQVKEAGLVDCVCQACASMSKSLDAAREQGLPVCDEMGGHPSMARYVADGYDVIVV